MIIISAKITVSYTDDKELQEIIGLLRPITHRIHKSNNDQGKYKKARIIPKEK